MKMIEELESREFDSLMMEATNHVSSDFPSELIPRYHSDEFAIKNYTTVRENEEVVFSP